MKVTFEIPAKAVKLAEAYCLNMASTEKEEREVSETIKMCQDVTTEISVEDLKALDDSNTLLFSLAVMAVGVQVDKRRKDGKDA